MLLDSAQFFEYTKKSSNCTVEKGEYFMVCQLYLNKKC